MVCDMSWRISKLGCFPVPEIEILEYFSTKIFRKIFVRSSNILTIISHSLKTAREIRVENRNLQPENLA